MISGKAPECVPHNLNGKMLALNKFFLSSVILINELTKDLTNANPQTSATTTTSSDNRQQQLEILDKIKKVLEEAEVEVEDVLDKINQLEKISSDASKRISAFDASVAEILDWSTMTLRDFFTIAQEVERDLLQNNKITAKITREDGTPFIEIFGQQINVSNIDSNKIVLKTA